MDKPIKIIKEGLNSDKTPKPYPKSIMKTKKATKIKPVPDPAKSPILKKKHAKTHDSHSDKFRST